MSTVLQLELGRIPTLLSCTLHNTFSIWQAWEEEHGQERKASLAFVFFPPPRHLAQGKSGGASHCLQAQGRYCLHLLESYLSFSKDISKVWVLESGSRGCQALAGRGELCLEDHMGLASPGRGLGEILEAQPPSTELRK